MEVAWVDVLNGITGCEDDRDAPVHRRDAMSEFDTGKVGQVHIGEPRARQAPPSRDKLVLVRPRAAAGGLSDVIRSGVGPQGRRL